MPLLRIHNIVKKFGGVTAVNHCSFEVEQGSITGLIGPNGAGKTTVFELVTGFLKTDSGEIYYGSHRLDGLAPYRRSRLGIGRTFQLIRIFPELTALENIMIALRKDDQGLVALFKSTKKSERFYRDRATELLTMVNLHDKAGHKASDLSYGQQKLLEIARATATGATLLLLDEPAAGVNRTMLHTIVSLIKKLNTTGVTFLIIEHDMGFIMDLCDRVIVMDYGKEIANGPPHEIQKNPAVLEAYLGKKS